MKIRTKSLLRTWRKKTLEVTTLKSTGHKSLQESLHNKIKIDQTNCAFENRLVVNKTKDYMMTIIL